jgi:hypothetical protein
MGNLNLSLEGYSDNYDSSGRSILPEGDYFARINSAEITNSKKNEGMIVLNWIIFSDNGEEISSIKDFLMMEGQYKNIGMSKLKAILKAGGKDTAFIEDTTELLELGCYLKIDVEEKKYIPKDSDEARTIVQNVIRKYIGQPVVEEEAPIEAEAPAEEPPQEPVKKAASFQKPQERTASENFKPAPTTKSAPSNPFKKG